MRINKFLASCGLGSRRKVEEYVISGRVSVNGKVETSLSAEIDENCHVEFDGKPLKVAENHVYIMLNKPRCYITSLHDERGRLVVTDLIKDCKYRIFPVGRLDYNTEGLLLLTNDGDFANKVTHPSKHIAKTYEVKLKFKPTSKQLNLIRSGIVIDGKKTLPARAEVIDFDGEFYTIHVTIFEGRNREIRKIFAELNLKIYGLKRLQIGGLNLGNLEIGKYKYLKKSEVESIFLGGENA